MKISSYISFLRKISFDFKAALFGSKEFPYDKKSESTLAYAIDYEFALQNNQKFYPHFDKNGIPIANYLNSGFQYNPTRIASYALANYNRAVFKTDKNSKQLFFNIADWFANQNGNLFYYQYNYESLQAPWVSCMGQGQGISVLCRAYVLTENKKYLQAAKKAAAPFLVNTEKGGVLSLINNELPILEEFPFTDNPWHVLNGFLYAIIGLVELREIDKTAFPETNFQVLLTTAEKGELWTNKNWTTYDLQAFHSNNRNTATVNYHRVHIAQYKYLAHKFPNRDFSKWANIWEKYSSSLIIRLTALINKIVFRLKNPATRF